MSRIVGHGSKGPGDENFPVASWLIDSGLRPHVLHFYAFARAADDVADDPDLTKIEKLRRLDAFEAGLDGLGEPAAMTLRDSLDETGLTDLYARQLLSAFRQDAEVGRYRTWDDLLDYCSRSANPVGRYLLDLHGEDQAQYPASDALCTVLQVLNHVQDCGEDYEAMDRVYLPLVWLDENQLTTDALSFGVTGPRLRRVFDEILDRCETMLTFARNRRSPLRSRRLNGEMVAITALAFRLLGRLRSRDPLAERVRLTKPDFAIAGLRGAAACVLRGLS
ncbi:MAG: squalene/phytoene synthase family protein [Pseudomonadota bacterium]